MSYTSRLDLPLAVTKLSVELLQARLVDAIDLEAQLKQAHWNVRGKDFFQLHGLFDQMHGEVENFVDSLAERIVALGGVADGRVQTVAAHTSLYEYPIAAADGEAHLKALAGSIAEFGKRVRANIGDAARNDDDGTADLFTGISRDTDKQLWFVEAHLSPVR
jgi:starvation-inducible DNA-binding protein